MNPLSIFARRNVMYQTRLRYEAKCSRRKYSRFWWNCSTFLQVNKEMTLPVINQFTSRLWTICPDFRAFPQPYISSKHPKSCCVPSQSCVIPDYCDRNIFAIISTRILRNSSASRSTPILMHWGFVGGNLEIWKYNPIFATIEKRWDVSIKIK